MAGKKIGLVLALDGEKEFKSAIKAVKEEVKLYGDSIKNLDKAFANNKNSAEALSKKQEALAKQQEAYRKQVDAAKSGLDNAKKAYNDQASALSTLKNKLDAAEKELKQMADAGDTSSDAYKKQKEEVDKLNKAISDQTTNLNNAQSRVNNWTREVNNSESALSKCDTELSKNEKYLKEAQSAADGCATSIDKFGNEASDAGKDADKLNISLKDMVKNKLVDIGGDVLRDLGQKAVEAAKYVIEVGSSFEAQMSKVQALSGATNSEMTKLTAVAAEMGRTTKFTATEAGEGLEYMALAGWKTEDMVAGLPGIMNLAAASGTELGTASDIVTDALTAFGASAGDAGRLADIMAASSTNANTTVEMMGETFKYVAPVAGALGYSMEDTSEAIGLMANAGIKGSQAGTSLRSIITRLSTDAGASSKSLGALGTLTEKLGVEFFNADGTARNLNDVLTDARAVWGGLTEEEQINYANTIAGKNAMSGWLALMNASPADVAKLEGALATCDGAAAAMAATMNDNLNGKITLMNSALEGLGVALYGYITGPLQGIVSGVTNIISGITNAISPQKTELEAFIEDIEKSNEAVSKSIESAKKTVADANAKVASLESTKTFLEGVLDNCSKFTQTDLSTTANKIDTDLDTATTAFKDTDEAAGDAKKSIEGIGTADVSTEKLGGAMETIQGDLKDTDDAAGNTKDALSGIGDGTISETNINTFTTAANGDLEGTEKAAGSAKGAIEGTGDVTIDTSKVASGTDSIETELDDTGDSADSAKKKVGDIGNVKIDGNRIKNKTGEIVSNVDAVTDSATSAHDELESIGDATGDVNDATTALGYLKDETSNVVVVTDEFTKSKITTMVNALGDSVQGLAQAWNAETGELSASKEQLDEWFDKAKEIAMNNALQSAMQDLYTAWGEAAKDAAMANSAVNEALREFNEEAGTSFTNWQEAIDYANDAESEWYESSVALNDAVDAQTACNETLDQAQEALDTTGKALEQFTSAEEDAKSATEGLNDATAEGTDADKQAIDSKELLYNAFSELVDITGDAEEATGALTDKQKESVQAFQEMADATVNDLVEMADQMGMTAGEFAEWCQEQVDAIEELEKNYGSLLESVTSAMKGYVENLDTSGEEGSAAIDNMVTHLQERTTSLQTWVENMKELGAMAGDGLPQSLYDHLLAEGPDKTMEAVQALVDAARTGDESFSQVADEWNKSLTLEAEAAVLVSYSQTGKDYAAAVAAGFIGSEAEYNQTVQDLINSGAISAKSATDGYTEAGAAGGQNVAGGMSSEEGTVSAAAESVAVAGKTAIEKSGQWFKAAGQAAVNAFRLGMLEQSKAGANPTKQAEDIAQKSAESAKKTSETKFKESGKAATDSYANAIKSSFESSVAQAKSLAEKAGEQAKSTSENKFRESGKAAVDAYASAISNNKHLSTAQALAAATDAGEAIDKRRYMFTGAGEAAIQAFGSGMGNNKHISTAHALGAATDAGEAIDKRRYMFTGAGESAVQAFGSGIGNNKHLATAQALAAATDAGSAVDKRRYMFTGAGTEAINAFARGISGSAGNASGAAGSASSSAAYSARGYYSSFYYAGSYVIDGFANGIDAYSYKAAYAAARAAANALASAKAQLGVASPSKEFKKIGRFVDEGFAEGIERNQKLIEDAAAKASKSTIDVAKKMNITSKLDIIGAEKLNQLTNISAETSDSVRAMRQLSNGLKVMSGLAESLSNPKAPNVTVMIGNREFKGYIVTTAAEGLGQQQRNLMRGVGA